MIVAPFLFLRLFLTNAKYGNYADKKERPCKYEMESLVSMITMETIAQGNMEYGCENNRHGGYAGKQCFKTGIVLLELKNKLSTLHLNKKGIVDDEFPYIDFFQ